MDQVVPCQRSFSRPLYLWEIEQARLVFGDQLDYRRIRIHECNPWPNRINQVGVFTKTLFKKVEKPAHAVDNAITLGNHCYFPVRLPELLAREDPECHRRVCWLIHELTHTWQYQQMGWRYLTRALLAQFRAGYQFGGEAGLQAQSSQGGSLHSFNLEQQGDIARSYYDRLCKGLNVDAWQAYIDRDIKRLA